MNLVWILFGIAVVASVVSATGIFLEKRLYKYGGAIVVAVMIYFLLRQTPQ